MRTLLMLLCAMSVGISTAHAACGKHHPETKEKGQDSRPAKRPE